MKIRFILLPLIILTSLNCLGQLNPATKCELLDSLINSKEVSSWFKEINRYNDSVIYFLDPQNAFSSCQITKWKGISVQFLNKGELIDSIKKYEFNFVIKNRFNYYQIREITFKSETTLYLHRGYDNLISHAKIIKRKNHYHLGKIESGVI